MPRSRFRSRPSELGTKNCRSHGERSQGGASSRGVTIATSAMAMIHAPAVRPHDTPAAALIRRESYALPRASSSCCTLLMSVRVLLPATVSDTNPRSTPPRQQFIVRAALDDAGRLFNTTIWSASRTVDVRWEIRIVVRPGHHPAQVPQDLLFRLRVHGRKGIVQDQNPRIAHDRAGNGRALLLSAGKRDASFSNHGLILVRQIPAHRHAGWRSRRLPGPDSDQISATQRQYFRRLFR